MFGPFNSRTDNPKKKKNFRKKRALGAPAGGQRVKCPTPGSGSGHDLRVAGSSPGSGCTLNGESASLSLPKNKQLSLNIKKEEEGSLEFT